MSVLVRTLVFLLPACCSLGFLFGEISESGVRVGPGYVIPWDSRSNINNEEFPCESEDFYPHPKNCSRFYRCVDFANTSTIFSRFLFECPTGNVFVKGINTCVPGSCPDTPSGETQQPEEPPVAEGGTEEPVDVGTPDVVDQTDATAGEVLPDAPPEPEVPETPPAEGAGNTEIEVGGSGSVDEAGTDVPVPANPPEPIESYPPVDTTGGGESGVTPVSECSGLYQQHRLYCNMFHLCNNDSYIYACNPGTAFQDKSQMCRVYGFDDSLCQGKELFEPASILRSSENWINKASFPLSFSPVENSMRLFIRDMSDDEKEVVDVYLNSLSSEGFSMPSLFSPGVSEHYPHAMNTRPSHAVPYGMDWQQMHPSLNPNYIRSFPTRQQPYDMQAFMYPYGISSSPTHQQSASLTLNPYLLLSTGDKNMFTDHKKHDAYSQDDFLSAISAYYGSSNANSNLHSSYNPGLQTIQQLQSLRYPSYYNSQQDYSSQQSSPQDSQQIRSQDISSDLDSQHIYATHDPAGTNNQYTYPFHYPFQEQSLESASSNDNKQRSTLSQQEDSPSQLQTADYGYTGYNTGVPYNAVMPYYF